MDSKWDPVNSVLSTPEVREKIMKKLDVASLLNCRLVSKPWNTTASSLLKKRPIWIKRKWDLETFGRLDECVKSSPDFPFLRLDFTDAAEKPPANMNVDIATQMFSRFGRIFTHLRASGYLEWHAEMLICLLKNASQLQFLEIGQLSSHINTEESPEFCLPALRTLRLRYLYGSREKDALVKLIRAAPRLEEIQHAHSGSDVHMTAIRETQTLTSVSSLTLHNMIDTTGTQILAELAGNPPQLTALIVEFHSCNSPDFLQAFIAILTHSQNSLKTLKVSNFCNELDELPVLHNLEELDFRVDSWLVDPNRPMAAVVPHLTSRLFPKLKCIRFEMLSGNITEELVRKHLWEKCEAPLLESVDRLEIASYCEPDVFKYLAKCFPRVTCVSLDYSGCKYGDTYRRDWYIWLLKAFPCLSRLDIHDFPFERGNMDSFLTGIPPQTVTKLRNEPTQMLSPCMNEVCRLPFNVLQLKSLRELNIICSPESRIGNENPFMTLVSLKYVLERVPDLRASFLYCSRKLRINEDQYGGFQRAFRQVKDSVAIDRCHCGTGSCLHRRRIIA